MADLVENDLSWIDRRKETIEITDETTVKRRVTVDFSLRSNVDPLLHGYNDRDALFCAPLFILPKAPPTMMNFDVVDESGQALRLVNGVDNGLISAAALVELARRALPAGSRSPARLAPQLDRELRALATAGRDEGAQRARRLLDGPSPPDTISEQLDELRSNPRFRWWLEAMGHSSLVVVLFRAEHRCRKLVKLSFEGPGLETTQPRLSRLGWSHYEGVINSELIAARSHHVEVQAPRGMRIILGKLAASPGSAQPSQHPDGPETDADAVPPADGSDRLALLYEGYARRIHLYVGSASSAGSATTTVRLVVAQPGLVGGALGATVITAVALLLCYLAHASFVDRPSDSATTFLLAVPGVIAYYVARPAQHALTTRLLQTARRLLLLSAAVAFSAAALVTLPLTPADLPLGIGNLAPDIDRAETLELGLLAAFFISLIPVVGWLGTWSVSRRHARGRKRSLPRYADCCYVAADKATVLGHIQKSRKDLDPRLARALGRYRLDTSNVQHSVVGFTRLGLWGRRVLRIRVTELPRHDTRTLPVCKIDAIIDYVPMAPGLPVRAKNRDRQARSVLSSIRDTVPQVSVVS